MAENYDLIFGQSASQQYAWSDSDYQNGWQTVGSTPPTAEQFDALQRRSDTKAQELNSRLTPIEAKSEADGRQMSTAYALGDKVTADGLHNGWLLECVVEGTSGSSAITIPATLIDGATIADGTVTWKLRKVATEGGLGYRQPNTTYEAGQIAYHASLPTGYYLECTTAGTTGSGNLTISSTTIGDTVTDGTATWTICKAIGTGNAPIYAGYNGKQTFTSSGSFTAPITGIYRITLQGGGGGGAGGATSAWGQHGGGGGGAGGHGVFYEKLTAGTSYTYTIGAGGAGGTANNDGVNGGASSITINNNDYVANGGGHGFSNSAAASPGSGGSFTINTNTISHSQGGGGGLPYYGNIALGGNGGGNSNPASAGPNKQGNSSNGAGGSGGNVINGATSAYGGGDGGDGYITFEWLDTSLL